MPKFDDYTQKTTPEDTDITLILDKTANVNKKTPFSGIWTWIVNKMTNAVIQNLQTTNKTVVGAINELNSKMKIITINGTTLQDGTLSLPYDVPDGVNQAYCISNVSANLSMPYSVTVMDVDSKSILFRIRKMGDNSAIANTAVNFDVLVFFI